ncbi:MAG: hemoglobin [Thermoleophilaceae bacterium]|nr:hemoglobin [Thermoleophilaceae bacterium]
MAKLDLEAHVPTIASFWETVLLGARSYAGGAFAPHARVHAKVELREAHFDRWLQLWGRTVDELFEGERADLAKAHALRVGRAFHRRLQGFTDTAAGVGAPLPLTVTRHGPRG